MTETTLIRSYQGLTKIAEPFLPIWVKRRALKGKEDPERQEERFGHASLERPGGALVWLHGASVGECLMFLPVVNRILEYYPTSNVLVTSGTVTSAEIMQKRLPLRAVHQYVPLDAPAAVNRFLDHWKPDFAIWAESEIWPNLIKGTKARKIPMALINARMSGDSLEGWGKRKESAKAIFNCFDRIIAANEDTANGLSWLLDTEVESAGNLKDAAPALPVNPDQLKDHQENLGHRPVWCAASTHAGEEEVMLEAHKDVLKTHKDALLILAPRHPDRRDEVVKSVKQSGLTHTLHSKLKTISPKTQVYILDVIGEMGLAFSLSRVTFVCGSLLPGMSGHNPLEPARLGNAVLTGAHISSFADTYMSMFVFNAAERILNPELIGPKISHLFETHEELDHLAKQSFDFAAGRDAVLDYIWSELYPLFPSRFK